MEKKNNPIDILKTIKPKINEVRDLVTFEKINLSKGYADAEDKFDVAVANEAYNEYLSSGKKSRPIAELWKEMRLL